MQLELDLVVLPCGMFLGLSHCVPIQRKQKLRFRVCRSSASQLRL